MFKKISTIVENCEICKRYKPKYYKREKQLRISAKHSFERISTDIYGPFKLDEYSHSGKKEAGYILSVTDIYSRFTRLFFSYSVEADAVINALEEWFETYGKPRVIISDNGRQYVSARLKKFLEEKDVTHTLVPIYSPASNGISEALNKTITFLLSINKRKRIDDIIVKIEETINMNFNRNIGAAPLTILNKYSPYDPLKRKIVVDTKKTQDPVRRFKLNDLVYSKDHKAKKHDRKYRRRKRIVFVGSKGQ